MNSRILSFVVIAALVSPVLHAASKSKEAPKDNSSSLAAALQAVSPDPLGGRLGLELANRTASTKLEALKAPVAIQRAEAAPAAATSTAAPIAQATPKS